MHTPLSLLSPSSQILLLSLNPKFLDFQLLLPLVLVLQAFVLLAVPPPPAAAADSNAVAQNELGTTS